MNCDIYPSLEGSTEEFNFNIPLLRLIYYYISTVLGCGNYCMLGRLLNNSALYGANGKILLPREVIDKYLYLGSVLGTTVP